MKNVETRLAVLLLSTLCLLTGAHAQLTPSADSYTNTAAATTNYGAKTLLDVESSQTAFIQFDLSAIPSGYKGANVAKASLKLYVNAVTTAGSFNVDYVNGTWSESTIDATNAPALGTTIAASVPLTTTEKNKYILIDITPAVQAWLNGTANDGIALVGNSPVNASFDSKESTTTSHSPELDIVFASGAGGGITGITTASGSGLMGGGTSGTLNLSLTNTCAANQVLEWNGTIWACASLKGGGTITGVTAGKDLTGGGSSGNVTLNLDTTKVPQLAAANTFTNGQTINTSAGIALFVKSSSTVPGTPAIGAQSNNFAAVEGITNATSSAGLYGVAGASSGFNAGVLGETNSPDGVGVLGDLANFSNTAMALDSITGGGVWGDGGGDGPGVIGTNDNGYAGYFVSSISPAGGSTMWVQNTGTGIPFFAGSGPNFGGLSKYCAIDNAGDLICTGTKNAIVPIDGGKHTVAMSAIESPQNWFEDAGSGQLSGGTTVVTLDPNYIQTVNTELEYQVFLTPYGDCKGLYVSSRTPTSFEVHELGAGTANVSFGYRVMALRRTYENVRFADHTRDADAMKLMQERAKAAAAHPQSHKRPIFPVPAHETAAPIPGTTTMR